MTACGYHTGGTATRLPADLHTIYVPGIRTARRRTGLGRSLLKRLSASCAAGPTIASSPQMTEQPTHPLRHHHQRLHFTADLRFRHRPCLLVAGGGHPQCQPDRQRRQGACGTIPTSSYREQYQESTDPRTVLRGSRPCYAAHRQEFFQDAGCRHPGGVLDAQLRGVRPLCRRRESRASLRRDTSSSAMRHSSASAAAKPSSTSCARRCPRLSLYDMDLAEVDLREVLDRARTPSLMSPFQVFFIRGMKNLYGRGKNDEKICRHRRVLQDPNPDALLIFVADHISIPADARRMDLTDKDRYERIRETLGKYCPIVELARVEEGDAVKWIGEYCGRARRENRYRRRARTGGRARRRHDDGRQRTGEAGALRRREEAHHAGRRGDAGARRQAALTLRTDRRDLRQDRARALEVLDAILTTGDGEEAAIGHLYMLSSTFRQMLVILERNVRDSRALWQALWQGFRIPPFAAEDIIGRHAATNRSRELTSAIRESPVPIWRCAPILRASADTGKSGARSDRGAETAGEQAGCRTSCRCEESS